jgi:hypothetical protein
MRFALIVAALVLLPICARAGCGPGETPTYQDIQFVEVKRYALVGSQHPRFTATFDQRYSGPAKRDLVYAMLYSGSKMPIAGTFVLDNAATLAPLQRVLEKDRFYQLKLTPTSTHMYLDGPEDSIKVTRCGVATVFGYGVHSFVERDAQWDRLTQLLDDLQSAIYAMAWQNTLRSAHYGDRCSKDSEMIGHPFPGVPPDGAHGILNDYPIATGGPGASYQIGDIYTTVGGFAYFVATTAAYERGVISTSDNTSVKVGINEQLNAPTLQPEIVEKITPLLLNPNIHPRLMIAIGNGACFSSNWDGSFPKP